MLLQSPLILNKMAHKTRVKQPINFVHAKDEYQSTSTSHEKKSEHPNLDGHEIKSFYEEIVGNSSLPDSAMKNNPSESRCVDVSKSKCNAHSMKRRHTSSRVVDAARVDGSPATSDCCNEMVKREMIGKEVSTSSRTATRKQENRFLHCAQDGLLKELCKLVEDGVNVNVHDAYGWTALMCASHTGHLPVVRYLLDRGARLTARDSEGRTSVDIARVANQHHLVKYYENMEQDSDSHHQVNHAECSAFYCEICQAEFKDTPLDVHKTSTVHLFNSRLPRKPTTYFLPENNKGFQMMLRAGWDKEKGLGSNEQGHKYPVKTVLKRNRQGLGTEADTKARVTHFGANDREAVKECTVKRKMKATTLNARVRERTLTKDKRKERSFRMAFSMD